MLRTLIVALAVCLTGCAARVPVPTTPGKASTTVLDVREGIATYYGPGLHGKTTASGARFDMNAMVAAHPSYPFGTVVRVTNLENDRSVSVRILDRGPAARIQAEGVIIDVSRGAAERLGFIREGRARVRVEVLEFGAHGGTPPGVSPRPIHGARRWPPRYGSKLIATVTMTGTATPLTRVGAYSHCRTASSAA